VAAQENARGACSAIFERALCHLQDAILFEHGLFTKIHGAHSDMTRVRRVGRSLALFSCERNILDEGQDALMVSTNSGFGDDGTDPECRSDGSGGCGRSGKNSSAKERAGCQLMRIPGDGGDAGRAGCKLRARSAHLRGTCSGSETLRLGLSRGGPASGRPTLATLLSIGFISSTKARNLCCDVGGWEGGRGGDAMIRDL